MGRLKDLTGMKFGRWTVIKRNGSDKHGKALWLCRCECGTERDVLGESLNSGKSKGCRVCHLSGENNPNYNPNITDEEREKGRFTNEDYKWKQEVKKQANYTCDCCGKRGGELNSHHLNDHHSHKEQRHDISNGVCLCESCHREFHTDYMGYYQNPCSEDDYLDFKEVKQNYDIR